MIDVDPALVAFLERNGYSHFIIADGQLCALQQFMFTTGLVVGLAWENYTRRYCYEAFDDALCSLQQWSGRDHPVGEWIKVKGHDNSGRRIDLLNPLFCE